MKFIEQDIYFEAIENSDRIALSKKIAEKSIDPGTPQRAGETNALGLRVRLGNEPIVKNLRTILEKVHGSLPPQMAYHFQEKEVYTIVHGIGVTRLKGNAKVDELQYDAEMVDDSGRQLVGAQTIDLIPHTRFREVIRANINLQGGLSVSGNASAELPAGLLNSLLDEFVDVGAAMNIQLSNSSSFIGKFTYSLKYPVVISTGIASNTCHWVLKPDEENTPLLGDQLLVQTVAVPKGFDKIKFRIKGTVKVDQGLLYKQQIKETDWYEVEVLLSQY
jgi:hypothetical protein